MAPRAHVVAAACALLLMACNDIDEFRTPEGKAFRGTVIGTDGESFIRAGFPAGTRLRLDFDPALVESTPGTLSSDDDECGTTTFSATPLVAIPPLTHDLLGQYDFPGAGRLRNYIFVARPTDGPLGDREAMVFVSLISDGSVEARVIAGVRENMMETECDCAARDAGQCAFFGVFPMHLSDAP